MPKQIIEINPFHGGLNSNGDPRDIKVEELSAATDVMVDEIGIVRTMGGNAAHDAASNPVVTIEPGYGLHYFSHDRKGGHVNVSDLSGEHTAVDHSTILTDSVSDWPVDGLIGATVNNTTDGSSGTITDNTATTVTVAALTGGSDNSWDEIGTDDYTITDFPETGEDYLVLANTAVFTDATCDYNNDPTITHDDDSGAIKAGMFVTGRGIPDGAYVATVTDAEEFELSVATTGGSITNETLTFGGGFQIFARNNDKWSTGALLSLGSTTGMKPTFYNVDGALRISDGNFGSNNTNKWYGYIKRDLFKDISPSYSINQWYSSTQKCNAPSASSFEDSGTFAGAYDATITQAGTGTSDQLVDILRVSGTSLNASSLVNVIKVEISWRYVVAVTGGVSITFKTGSHDNSTGYKAYVEGNIGAGHASPATYTGTKILYINSSGTTVSDTDWDQLRTEITASSGVTSAGILSVTAYESGTLPDHSALLDNENVRIDFDWETTDGGSLWSDGSTAGVFEVGVTFIYDESQESQITICDKDTIGSATQSLTVPGATATYAPAVRVFIADFASTTWNKRITGLNVYMREVGEDDVPPWFLQLSGDFITGKMKVELTQIEYDAKYYAEATQPYYYWEISNHPDGEAPDVSVMLSPSFVTSYQINTGLEEIEKSIISKYRSAVVVGRMVYIGGLQVELEDGATENKLDAMIKSPVNSFDMFPLSRIIEASVQDGDEIVKLEEYADRILQFKKNKMHIINVSQQVEFLEDTFMHKGVAVPSAVCKTDYGVAWVNSHGCYLYDGKQVNDLLEKGGLQIINERGWAIFTGNEPMIGYLPKKRQLIVVDDNTSTGTGKIFLYDMVTQSWVQGSDATFTSNNLTNFVTDWDGDLVHAHTSGVVVKWVDTSLSTSALDLATKDMTFGQPGQRKKLYKAYITYKGDGQNVTVKYAVNGETDSGDFKQFNSEDTPLEDKSSTEDLESWHFAELKPTTSADATNIYSAKIHLYGAAGSTFAINDMNLVYRLKNIK